MGPVPKSLAEIDIPDEYRFTYKNEKFYYDDSGANDQERILVFTTEANIKLLEKNRVWYCDGTFDITPTLFTQLYSIHVIVHNKNLPMIYALLPNKLETTYIKLFKMIKSYLKHQPESVNIDFEKAVINAVEKVWKNKCLR